MKARCMNNTELNFHNVKEIIKSDICRGSENNHWIELTVKCENGETVNICCWGKTQDSLIIKNEEI